ncbi:hypothetical protein CR513_11214, partial [Mucuna pruriens]
MRDQILKLCCSWQPQTVNPPITLPSTWILAFISLDDSSKRRVLFTDNRSLIEEGIGRMVFRDKDGRETIIEEVLYIPGMKTNLLSLGQQLQKGFAMIMEDNYLKVFVLKQGKSISKQDLLDWNKHSKAPILCNFKE